MTPKEYFVNIIAENLAAGFIRGQELFQESLDYELRKGEILESIGVVGCVDALIEDYNKNN